MRRRVALLTGGYFVLIAIMLAAVLPFALDALRISNDLEGDLGQAQTELRNFGRGGADQESGVRGYVFSGDDSFLAPFESGIAASSVAERKLRELDLTRAERAAFDDMVESLANWQRDGATPKLAAVRAGQLAEGRRLETSGAGKQLFDDYRAKQRVLSDLLESRVADRREQLHRNSILAIAALLVATAIAIASAIAVRRAIKASFERDEERVREQLAFAQVHQLTSVLAERFTMSEVADIAATQATALLGASSVDIWVVSERDRVRLAATTADQPAMAASPSVLSLSEPNGPADVITGDAPLYFSDTHAFAATYPGWASTLDAHEATAVAIVPARSNENPIAAIAAYYPSPREFSEAHRTLLALTADQIGTALERERTREREHEAAVRLQESLLGPAQLVDGVGHSTRYLAAESTLRVGGDWHNAQRLPDGRVLIAIGDVVGRGLEAAMVMGQLRSAVSACAPRCPTPGDLLDALDDFAVEIPGAISTTVALAFVDVEKQTLSYVCAGHPPPVLVSPEGEVQLLDDAVTWPLAVGAKRQPRLGREIDFPAGSLVVLYSDGLIERREESLDEGIARLMRAARECWQRPLDSVCDHILGQLLVGRQRDDDVAMLALRSPAAVPALFLTKTRATPDSVGRVRERLRSWLDNFGLPPDDQLAILVAVGEACTNAVEHAYSNEGSTLFRVEANAENDRILCCVTDTGAWKDNAQRNARGNGFAIMRELMDEVVIDRRTNGTSVTLTYRLGVRDEPALLG